MDDGLHEEVTVISNIQIKFLNFSHQNWTVC